MLVRELRPNFVTVIAGIYDPGTGELTYAKAGHAPPIVLGTAHDPAAEEPVPPIGLGVGEEWPEYRVRLGEGVSVCFFTDGLQDAEVGDAGSGATPSSGCSRRTTSRTPGGCSATSRASPTGCATTPPRSC